MKAIIFDLFETLITEWGRYKYTTREIASDLGMEYRAFKDEWEKMHCTRYLGELPNTESVLNHILELLEEKPRPALTKAIGDRKDRNKAECFASIKPEILSMLDMLKEQGYQLGLISNCTPEEIRELPRCGLSGYFASDALILSCRVGLAKPDKAIYELCAQKLGVNASECLYVGDGGSDELAGAEAAGMNPVKAVWFSKQHTAGFDEDRRFPLACEPADILMLLNTHFS